MKEGWRRVEKASWQGKEKMKEKSGKGKVSSNWEESRKKFLEDKKLRIDELGRRREKGEEWCGELIKEGKEKNRKEKWEKIKESRFNRWYKVIRGGRNPGIFQKGMERK